MSKKVKNAVSKDTAVVAIRRGYYGSQIKDPGAKFTIKKGESLASWMAEDKGQSKEEVAKLGEDAEKAQREREQLEASQRIRSQVGQAEKPALAVAPSSDDSSSDDLV